MAVKTMKHIYYGHAFLGGVIGALVMLTIMAIARGLNLTEINMPLILGSMLTGNTVGNTWSIGFLFHLINGGIFALIYAATFQAVKRASPSLGIGFGFIHWIISGLILAILPQIHSLIPEQIAAPGPFAANTNTFTILAILAGHLIFGGIVGAICAKNFYKAAVQPISHRREEFRKVS